MKKIYVAAFVLSLSFLLAAPTHAEIDQDPDRTVDSEISRIHTKLTRGIKNIATFPLEIPKQTKKTVEELKNDSTVKKVAVIVPGVLRGVGHSMVRLISGVWDVISFNVNFPKNHEPFLKPDYAWDEEEE